MKWDYCLSLYLDKHCMARGLRAKSMEAYRSILEQFRDYIERIFNVSAPEQISSRMILEYVDYLRKQRNNGDSAINRTVTVIRSFYRALVGMGYMNVGDNPMKEFPKIKAPKRKFRDILNWQELKRLFKSPLKNTIMGIRDRAILILLYGTGIRSSECEHLLECNVKLDEMIIHVTGKGGDERTIPLNENVATALREYRQVRGKVDPDSPFFKSRKKGRGLSRFAIYERVRTYARLARIKKNVSPHTLRHSFATDLIRKDVNIVTLRDLLGHRQLSSTQIYLHMTAADIREAVERHPIAKLVSSLKNLIPGLKLPFQYPPGQRFAFNS